MAVTETARAKINLALHVTARRADGYHELDSLVAFADIGDQLTIEPAEQMSLELSGPFARQLSNEHNNIVSHAAEEMRKAWPGQAAPVRISLTKNLPVASGIGGGSADAAAALRGLQRLYDLAPSPPELDEIAMRLGADVPVCLMGSACRMRGIGEDLQSVNTFPALSAVLVNPGSAVSTPQVFAKLDLQAGQPALAPMPQLPVGDAPGDWLDWLAACRNDLQPPAISLVPEIQTVLNVLEQTPGCSLHRMSGSGATCFGLFYDQLAAQKAADTIAAHHPAWWVRATVIR